MDAAIAFDGKLMAGDLALDGAALATDGGLATAVVVSLFSDRRARADDALPDSADGDPRGWWGDLVPPVEGDRIGSRLWLLAREKQLPAVVARAKEYTEEALAWLIEDGIASRVEVSAEISRPGVLGLAIAIYRPGGGREEHRFSYIWSRHAV
jgi:phage gp46-like protein